MGIGNQVCMVLGNEVCMGFSSNIQFKLPSPCTIWQVVDVHGMQGLGFEALDKKREEEEMELTSFSPEDAKE